VDNSWRNAKLWITRPVAGPGTSSTLSSPSSKAASAHDELVQYPFS